MKNKHTLHTVDLEVVSSMGRRMLLPLLGLYVVPFVLLHRRRMWRFISEDLEQVAFLPFLLQVLLTAVVLCLGIVLHELIHGLVWSVWAKGGRRSIRFGFDAQHHAPYCHCTAPLRVYAYVLGALAPFFVLGLLPMIHALVYGNFLVLLFAYFFTVTAVGDILVVRQLSSLRLPRHAMILDHPSQPGFYTTAG